MSDILLPCVFSDTLADKTISTISTFASPGRGTGLSIVFTDGTTMELWPERTTVGGRPTMRAIAHTADDRSLGADVWIGGIAR